MPFLVVKNQFLSKNEKNFKRKFLNQHVGWTKNNEIKAPESKNCKKNFSRGVQSHEFDFT